MYRCPGDGHWIRGFGAARAERERAALSTMLTQIELAVIDHVVENVATLEETLRAVQSAQRLLRVERELAERIERGTKSLRNKIGSTAQTEEDEPLD